MAAIDVLVSFRVREPECDDDYFTVSGVAPEGVSHYDLQDKLRPMFHKDIVDFDSEQGTFFAYANDRSTALRVRDAAERMAHRLVSA